MRVTLVTALRMVCVLAAMRAAAEVDRWVWSATLAEAKANITMVLIATALGLLWDEGRECRKEK